MDSKSGGNEWHIPRNIHPLFHDGGVVYFNSEAGSWGVSNRRVGRIMLEAAGVIDNMELVWPELESGEAPSYELVPHVMEAGLLAPGQGLEERSAYPCAVPLPNIEETDIGSVLMVRGALTPMSLQPEILHAARACIDQSLSLVASVKSGERFTTVIEAVQDARGNRAERATTEQAIQAAETIRWVGESHFSKLACLERTLSAALLGAYENLDIEVHIGAGVDPIAFHAWPAAQGNPVCLAYDETITGRFYSVLTF